MNIALELKSSAALMFFNINNTIHLAKLADGLDESPTVMVVETNNRKLGKNRGILKPSWYLKSTMQIL